MLTKRTRHILLSSLAAFIVVYFLYHTIQGERGWVSLLRLQSEVKESKEELSGLQQERETLAHKVDLMKAKSADPDLLDEEARRTLNYSKLGDIIILKSDKDKEGKKPQ